MKMIKRLFFGIIFPIVAITVIIIVAPISWIITGDFDAPVMSMIEFYQDL